MIDGWMDHVPSAFLDKVLYGLGGGGWGTGVGFSFLGRILCFDVWSCFVRLGQVRVG